MGDVLELAWLAGWLEGEGCFHLGQKDGRPRFVIEAASVDRDVVARAHHISGVGRFRQKLICDSGKPLWGWRVDKRADVLKLAEALRPHMGARRGESIDAMLKAAEAQPSLYATPEDRSRAARKSWATRRAQAVV